MDKFREEFIKSLLETLKIPATAFNIAIAEDEIACIPNDKIREFFKEVLIAESYGNGMKAIINTAKKFKPDILASTAEKAKNMYDKFYAQQSAMLDYSQTHRDEVPNDREWFNKIDYSKLKNRDGSKTYTKQELYVLKELGGGEFLLNLRFTLNSSHVVAKIKKIIDKAIKTKHKKIESIESKRVTKMLSKKVA